LICFGQGGVMISRLIQRFIQDQSTRNYLVEIFAALPDNH